MCLQWIYIRSIFKNQQRQKKQTISLATALPWCNSVETENFIKENDEPEFTDKATTDFKEERQGISMTLRQQKRCRHIRILKDTLEYKEYLMYGQRSTLITLAISENMPATPDPLDEKISKRTWDKNMVSWREALSSHVYKLKLHSVGKRRKRKRASK